LRAVDLAFAIGWVAFWLYWLAAAASISSTKRAKRAGTSWSRHVGYRLVVLAVVIVLVRLGVLRNTGLDTDPWRGALGLVVFALGLGFAIWARVHLGRNWGVPMTERDEPELVTSGPYHLVRHPIYAGILLALVGTAVGLGWILLIAAVYFVYSATVEERYLTDQLPDTYPAYKRSTKMLVPGVF
jgi:protein-S-isoprenylcysteine O-methyltransferase Ste14